MRDFGSQYQRGEAILIPQIGLGPGLEQRLGDGARQVLGGEYTSTVLAHNPVLQLFCEFPVREIEHKTCAMRLRGPRTLTLRAPTATRSL